MLLRHAVGATLRTRRAAQGRSLREVATAACCAVGYLSELERGQKEASSEMLAAVSAALATSVGQVLRDAAALLDAEVATLPQRIPVPVTDPHPSAA